MNKTDAPVIVEQHFNAPIETVWKAITEWRHMQQWFFKEIETFVPAVGFQTRFVVENEGRLFKHLWRLTDVVPHKKITYNWRYEGYAGDALVCFELFDLNGKTLLRLTHTVTVAFDKNITEFKRESCLSGWRYFINQSLRLFLEKKPFKSC